MTTVVDDEVRSRVREQVESSCDVLPSSSRELDLLFAEDLKSWSKCPSLQLYEQEASRQNADLLHD